MKPPTQDQQVILAVANAIIKAVAEAGPTGTPGGVIYAALMTHGCTLAQYEALMGTLVKLNKIRKRGECYFSV